MIKIEAPCFNDYESIIEFSKKLSSLSEQMIEIDFSNIGFARPKGMLLLSSIIRKHFEKYRNITPIHYENQSYPLNMGFFSACGFDIQTPCNVPGNVNYMPIKEYTCQNIRDESIKNRENAGETVERISGDLSQILTRSHDGEIYKTIKYSLREIMRNIVEHSDSDNFYVSGQYWTATSEVELSIIDGGIGLKESLSRNPHLNISDDYHAIQLGLLPGVSGKTYSGLRIENRTEWTNSGFGLFMTSQICRMGGEFFIGSGDHAVSLNRNSKNRHSYGLNGTFVVLKMNMSGINQASALLKIISKKGENIAKMIGGGANIEASSASKLIMS